MLKTKLFSAAIAFMSVVMSGVSGENLVKNGSFEEDAVLSNVDAYTQKGFTVKKEWTSNWIINIGTKPCDILIVEEASAPDGKKFLRIKTSGASHIYSADTFPGNTAVKLTFSARGEALDGKGPVVKVHAYLYKISDNAWYGKNQLISTLNLEKDWKSFSVDIPAQPEDSKFRLAFEFEGACDIDNVKIEK